MTNSEVDLVCQRVVDALEQYILRRKGGADRFAASGRKHVVEKTRKYVAANQRVEFVLPAFPFKSPSPKKVLGQLPDFGEYYSLYALNALCETVGELYEPGAVLTLVSDGSVYHDAVGVREEDFLRYDAEVRRMGADFAHLRFLSIQDILPEEEYRCYVRNKQEFFAGHLEGFDLDAALKTDENLLQVYRGYLKFMTDDLEVQLDAMDVSKNMKKRHVSAVAKELLRRGHVYSYVLARKFPDCVRLSIHCHNNAGPKIAVAVSPHYQARTPWHNVMVLRRTGRLELMKLRDAPEDATVVTKYGRPWMMVEHDPDLLEWDVPGGAVEWEVTLPFGLIVHFPAGTPLDQVPQEQLRRLVLKYGMVVVRGVSTLEDQAQYDRASGDFGVPQSWFFGNVLTVKDNPDMDVNNVLSKEAMPMHFDGLFKIDENGKPISPHFQYFYCKTPAGTTYFSDTRAYAELFPSMVDKQWKVFTPKNESFGGTPMLLDLFEKHRHSGDLIFRFHEPWGQEKTVFKPTRVEVLADDGERWAQRFSDSLYSRRFCRHHVWEANDIVITDNLALMHTRPAYTETHRELWRIHYN
eukprot:CAMPEP_0119131208 /NCGR_PEP_ID=MMETSP1310-20130426/9729_1 /TAXON_ID=464262 /ORGANISM="Genus nov. species nov., Strain RCC2339" /LENGTH=578 /DNA_ID=CAMNT_0007121763 /DNA_START=59 /DNA_END=1795 /DNA_ORIENTATION=+